jgi:alpha-ribazole phosphatase
VRHTKPLLPDDRKRFVGRSDPPLSATGFEQAHRLAEQLRPIRFDSIHSSDLQRCLTTAEIIANGAEAVDPPYEHGDAQARPGVALRVRPDARLREIGAGLWEWLTFEEAAARYPEEYAERERDLIGYRFPAGESFRDLRERVVPAFLEIVDEGGPNVLVVAHLGVNRVLLCEFLGLPLESVFSIKQDYGCVNLIKVSTLPDGTRRVEVLATDLAGS